MNAIRPPLPASALPLLLVPLVACAAPLRAPAARHATLDELFDDYYAFKLRINPIEATKLGERGHDAEVANFVSAEYQDELVAAYAAFLDEIAAFADGDLSAADRLSLRVMEWDCAIKKEGLENPLATVPSPVFDMPVLRLAPMNQIFSLQLYFGQLASGGGVQPFRTVADYDRWLERVHGYVAWVDTAIENMREGMAQGIVQPTVIVERMLGQLDGVLTDNVEAHLFWGPIRALPAGISAADKERLSAAFTRAISDEVNPAYARLRAFLAGDYLSAADDHTGLCALPHRAETYRYLVRYHTTTDLTPDEIFELGQREVARISDEMEAVMRRAGFQGSLRKFFDHVRTRPEEMPFTAPEQVIASFEAIHARMQPHLRELFDVSPRAGFEVRRTEAFRERSASAEYVPGTKDGSRPGVFYVPIPDVRQYNRFSDESLFLHEAIPGHHYQLSLQQENDALPEFLHPEGIGVFVEGWALYCESLGAELGLYTDPYQLFGMLSAEMHRAIRLVVDTGMHAKGWSREEAIRYSLDHEARSEDSIVAEVERYMAMPGQALSYKVGQLKILELRRRAERTLGAHFDVREFHRELLGSGSLPLVLLEEKIDNWIAAQRS